MIDEGTYKYFPQSRVDINKILIFYISFNASKLIVLKKCTSFI